MIFLFPNVDTLHLALTSGVLDSEAILSPAVVSFDKESRPHVESTVTIGKAATDALKRLGVKGSKRHAGEPQEVANWLQILPVVRDSATPELSSQAPVLFELAAADDLPTLVTEMLRLGNDRQGFRWFTDPADGDNARVLLRVVGPPYYTLLRALDRTSGGGTGAVRAYLERAPRVWVEVGYTHPLANQLRVAEGQFVLVRPPRTWVFLDEAPFQDVYDILQFPLPAEPTEWAGSDSPTRIEVPLRLTAGNAADLPEFWVLRDDPISQLDALVRDSADALTARLLFTIASDAEGNKLVVLRTRPSKLPPPVLPLENAVGFKPFFKLTNLFVPVGQRLHPTLRRDAVRRLLADDPDQVVWLQPEPNRRDFTPMSVPDGAFRSLADWVDYLIEAEQAPLAAWIESTRFDFESFICRDNEPKQPKDPGPPREARPRDGAEDAAGKLPRGAAKSGVKENASAGAAEFQLSPEVKKPSEWLLKRKELEAAFVNADGPLDAPERRALWPKLAAVNTAAGDAIEASICWLNAMWDAGDPPPAEWIAGWLRSELSQAAGPMNAAEFDHRLQLSTPTLGESRTLLASFLSLAERTPVPGWLTARLPAVQKYLEQHERSLPVRAVWLVGFRLSQLAGADVLGLARLRDRLLQRLLEEGLSPERDMPGFLRYAGLRDSERLRAVRDKALDLHATIRKWITDYKPGPHMQALTNNLPYVDLFFAFALAKLGEATPARKLLGEAQKALEGPGAGSDDKAAKAAVVKNSLFQAFQFRIVEALAGKPHAGPMGPEAAALMAEITRKAQTPATRPVYSEAEYVIGRMRLESFILEPHERLNPYFSGAYNVHPIHKEISALHGIHEPAKFAERVRRMYRDGIPGSPIEEVRFLLLGEMVPLAPRVGEAFAIELLRLVPATLAAASLGRPEPADLNRKKAELYQRSLFLAAHFGQTELVQEFVALFIAFVHAIPKEADKFEVINIVASQSLQSLRKVGLRDQVDRLLGQFHREVLKGQPFSEVRKQYAVRAEAGTTWGSVLQTLLNIATAWLTLGRNEEAAPILDEARNELLTVKNGKLQPKGFLPVSLAYVGALGQTPSEMGLAKISELFEKMDAGKLTNTWTGSMIYSRTHLLLVEAVVLALVSENSALGPAGRRWLDDDEYLVRRRIHRDMQHHLQRGGY